jgi:putative ABC transport system permease protein
MTFASLAARNLLRNKIRTALTIAGVAVAIVTFLLLRTVVSAWTGAAEFAAKDRVVSRHKVTFIMPLPMRYVQTIRDLPDVKHATFANWFGGRVPGKEREFFATLAVDPKTYFTVYDELSFTEGTLQAFVEDKGGAVVGDVLARKFGWKLGDQVTLESGIFPNPGDRPWTLTVRGIYTTTSRTADRSTLFFHWSYLNDGAAQMVRDQVGWVVSRIRDSSRTAEVGQTIDRIFDAEDNQTLSQDEASFNTSFLAGFSVILDAIDVVSAVILVIMMLVLGNTIAMGVRERTSEYGAMRAIGFLPKHIAGFVMVEAMVLSAFGGVAGVLLSLPIVEKGLGGWLEQNMGGMFPFFRVPPLMMVAALLLSVFLGFSASVLPAWRASKIRVTEALRRVV